MMIDIINSTISDLMSNMRSKLGLKLYVIQSHHELIKII